MNVIRTHFLTITVFAGIAILGSFLTIANGRGLGTIVESLLSNILQPLLIFICTCAILRLAGLKFTAWVIIGAGVATGAVALLQFVDFAPAWQLRAWLGRFQGSPSQIEEAVVDRTRPMGLSLTPIIFSYHIATAYIITNLLYRRKLMSPPLYGVLVLAMMGMSAANGTRSLLLAIFVHEVLFSVTRLRLGSFMWLVALAALGTVGLLYLDATDSRVANLDDASAIGRWVLWTFGSHLAMDHPFGFGWGFDPTDYAWLYWEDLSDFGKAEGVFRLAIHNAFLNFFLNFGIYGVTIIAFAAYIKPKKFVAAFFAFTAYFVNAFFHNAGVFVGEYYFWFGFAVFLYVYAEQTARGRSPAYSVPPRQPATGGLAPALSLGPSWHPAALGVAPAVPQWPKPSIPDAALLTAIKADLEEFPREGDGHRDVWARLRVCRGIRVSPRRVLRVMRENDLLSPDRPLPVDGITHQNGIAPHPARVMWSTGGIRIFTAAEGWAWIFTAVEHATGECIGWYVGKRGDRFAALEPVSAAITRLCGSTAPGVARGLVLRIGHGSQYLSDDFMKQIGLWGIAPSYAFIEQPAADDVFERFDRTLKETVVQGRTYRTVEELRNAFEDFVDRYDARALSEEDAGRNLLIRGGQRAERRARH